MRILALYSSTSGNTEFVLEYISEMFTSAGSEVVMRRAEQDSGADFDAFDLVIFACGTYGHGILQERMQRWIDTVGKDLQLQGKNCAIIGLGDAKYDREYLCESAALLRSFVEKHGGNILGEPLRIAGSPMRQLKNIGSWTSNLVKR